MAEKTLVIVGVVGNDHRGGSGEVSISAKGAKGTSPLSVIYLFFPFFPILVSLVFIFFMDNLFE